jgi:hypothetical protein
MDVAAHLLILVGIGCLFMGFVLLSQGPHEQAREIKVELRDQETHEDSRNDPLNPVTKSTDRIWLQETRELSEPVRPFPTF